MTQRPDETAVDVGIHLLTGAYALDALDDVERARFERHLARCASCADEVAGMQEAAAAVAETLATPMPARLRAEVLAVAARTPQEPAPEGSVAPTLSAEARVTEASVTPAPAAQAPLTGPQRGRHRSRSRWTDTRWLALAASVLAVVGLGLTAVVVDQRRELADAQRDVLVARGLSEDLSALLAAPDVRVLPLDGTGVALVVSTEEDAGVLVGSEVPQPEAGRVYQAWTIDGAGAATSGGTFVPDADGRLAARVSGGVGDAAAVAVTVEPAGGSGQPTTTPIFAVEL